MKIAVTGGSGQLGSLAVQQLCALDWVTEVRCLDVRPPRFANAKLRYEKTDIRSSDLESLFRGVEAVVHLAYLIGRRVPSDVFRSVNVDGCKRVFDSAVKARVPQLVYSSSVAAYGPTKGQPNPIVEESPRKLIASFAYAAAKFEMEAYLDELEVRNPEMRVARLRPSILVGERMDHQLGRTLRRGFIPSLGNGTLALVWDEDVADAIVLAIKKGANGAFNLCADDLLPPVELARAVGMLPFVIPSFARRALVFGSRILEGVGIGKEIDPDWLELGDLVLHYSSDKAKRELGWRPTCPTAVDVMRRFRQMGQKGVTRRVPTPKSPRPPIFGE